MHNGDRPLHRSAGLILVGFVILGAGGLWATSSVTFGQAGLGFGGGAEEEETGPAPGTRPEPYEGYYDEQVPEGFKRVPFPTVPTAEQIEAGKRVYFTKCVWCHGVEGAGDGPSADRLWPRPRNFAQGIFKIRHTASGELPLMEDLFQTVTHGLPGSVMPSWQGVLTDEQKRNVIAFITSELVRFRSFSDTEFESYTALDFDKIEPIPPTPESIAKGKQLFMDKKCFECHGVEGRGDGNPINLKDDWGFPIQPRNLHKCWNIRGSRRHPYDRKNVFRTFSTGINGTPMPSFADNTTIEQRWHLTNFVWSLCERDENGDPLEINPATNRPEIDPVIPSNYVKGEIPADPDAQAWQDTPRRWVALGGQLTHKPRNFVTRIDDLWVRALYNDEDIAFLIRWDDRIKSVAPDPLPWQPTEVNLAKYGVTDPPAKVGSNENTSEDKIFLQEYGVIDSRPGEKASLAGRQNQYTRYNDAVAVQFPINWKKNAPREKPRFFWGDQEHPVDLIKWSADGTIQAFLGTGWDQDFQTRTFTDQLQVRKAEWKDGRWTLIIQRPLKGTPGQDASFETGRLIPAVFFAWDGHNGDAGRKMSHSPYYYVALQPKSGDPLDVEPPPEPSTTGLGVPQAFQVNGSTFGAGTSTNPFRVDSQGTYNPSYTNDLLPAGGQAHLFRSGANPWDPEATGYLKAVREGGAIFFQNCHFCHADNLNGANDPTGGFFSYASIPRPTDLTQQLGQLSEVFSFWRVATGGLGLPPKGTPWATSTMPAMEEHLSTDDIWKVVLFSYWHTDSMPKQAAPRRTAQ